MGRCSYRFGPALWGSMAEWHGEKNLQVSRDRSWSFMARFTPSAILQAGGGFVNPLLNDNAMGFSSCWLCPSRCGNSHWENTESHVLYICITPGGNTFAQCARQLILTMSGVLGKEDETKISPDWLWKGLTFGPSWEEGGLRRNHFAHTRTNAESFDLSAWLSSNPG